MSGQINELLSEFKSYKAESRATPDMAELLISLYQQENLWGMMYEAFTHAALEYNGAGEPWMATKYAQLAGGIGIPAVGEDHSDVVEMESLAEDPWSHWSWMLRTKKGMGWGKTSKGQTNETGQRWIPQRVVQFDWRRHSGKGRRKMVLRGKEGKKAEFLVRLQVYEGTPTQVNTESSC